MKLDKDNTKQIIKIVVIAIVLLVGLLNIVPVWNVVKVFLSIISPFIWGLAIAFILNIFMTLYENKLFNLGKSNKSKNNKIKNKNNVINNKNSVNGKSKVKRNICNNIINNYNNCNNYNNINSHNTSICRCYTKLN